MKFSKRFRVIRTAKFDLGIEVNKWMEVVYLASQVTGNSTDPTYTYHKAVILKFGFHGFAIILSKYRENKLMSYNLCP